MISKRTAQRILSVLLACIVGYFVYHTIQGDRGWLAMLRKRQQVESAQSELNDLQKEHHDLDRRVKLLRPESIDPDLLDEESRKALDYSKPNDIVILNPAEKNTSSKKLH